ncbi:sterol uptake control protein 2 [Fusarium austroafricanum]|uniref:Sterol uptake control protein 2 n=1 Tax=Fusarium austroafricanum TaxID=2364996 RepID=A0A8H4K8X7_9HYPO|nr:sterol uptake control protein 2 [Fusarium austroafricanum]
MPPRTTRSGAGPGSGSGSRAVSSKPRRTHRKSRNGCWECKRRHIKCDEKRPACSNCVVSERTCSFPPPTTSAAAPSQQDQLVPSLNDGLRSTSTSRIQSPAESISSPGTLQASSSLPPPSYLEPYGLSPSVDDQTPSTSTSLPSFAESVTDLSESPLPTPTFTNKHLILLHHFRKSSLLDVEMVDIIIEVALEWSSQAPYALDQLLALSADHLATLHPESTASYRRTATELQTRALTYFNRDSQEIVSHNIPQFLFSSLLSLHMLYDTFSQYRASFHVFIERFCDSVSLHRGVRSTTSPAYQALLDSPLAPFFKGIKDAAELGDKGDECAPLITIIENSDLSPATVNACIGAAQMLQWAFNVHRNLPQSLNVQAASGFPVRLSDEFVQPLRKHRPEALLVLAYYGVLLHRCRHTWLFGDSGAFLIHLIADHLGSYWKEALRWPLEELEIDQG